ncbi:hypothetical protein [Arthrobacter psychrolactophilus]
MNTNTTTQPPAHAPLATYNGRFHPFGKTITEDLELLAAGEETGWWDATGTPAPWPQDFMHPAAGWNTGQDNNAPGPQKPAITNTPAPF